MFSTSKLFQALNFKAVGCDTGVPSWLGALREDDARYHAAAPLPSFRNDEWKYSALTALWKGSFTRAAHTEDHLPDELKKAKVAGAHNVFLLNGRVIRDDVLLPGAHAGITLLDGKPAFDYLNNEQAHFNAFTPNDSEFFCRLNRYFFDTPLVVVAEQGVMSDKLIHLVHIVSAADTAIFPRVFIRAHKGSAVNVLQTFISVQGVDYLSVPVTDILCEDGSIVEYAERHEQSSSAFYIGSVRAWQGRDSVFRSMISTGGAGLFRSNFSVIIEGEGASSEVNGLHALEGDNHADSHTFLEHRVANTTSNQLYKCVLDGESRSVFNGRVFVHREAQQTNSYQLNKNLLLSRDCRVDTKPQLEIKADDVKCTHGATIGRLNEEQLFYLQTRAIPDDQAVRMLVRGFIDDVLAKVRHPLIRDAFNPDSAMAKSGFKKV